MCTSIISNKGSTLVGWNFDILNMEYKVVSEDDKVYIAVYDKNEGWLPLFGANARGDFVAMPTCWPYDSRSDPSGTECRNIINLDIDLLLMKKTFEETRCIAEEGKVCSVPGVTFQAQLSDAGGNVLQIIPGQGCKFIPRPDYCVLTNFSPFKGDSEKHPWMGFDRYKTACELLRENDRKPGVKKIFEILKNTSQTVCPTVVSMVFDVSQRTVYWCENRQWDCISQKQICRI